MDFVQYVWPRSGFCSSCNAKGPRKSTSSISPCQAMMARNTRKSLMRWPWRKCMSSTRRTRSASVTNFLTQSNFVTIWLWLPIKLKSKVCHVWNSVFSCNVHWLTSCVPGSSGCPGVCGDVQRRGSWLVGSPDDVANRETVHGQVLCCLCPESAEVDWTWGRVQDGPLWN